MQYDTITTELNRLINRYIAKLLDSLGDSISPVAQKEIKHQFRQLEKDIKINIFNINAGKNTENFIGKNQNDNRK